MATRIIVVGCYRSGSTAIASILHHLGVDMGMPFYKSHFEGSQVAAKLRTWWNEPTLEEMEERENRVLWLKKWVERRERRRVGFVGVKHPLIGCRPEDFSEAWGEAVKVVWAYRPLNESVASLKQLQWMAGFDEDRIQSLLQSRVSMFLHARDHLIIENSKLKRRPLWEVEKLVEYLNLEPDAKALGSAFASLSSSF
jgi:hypothetical protein